jgi:hypothetical protein
MAHNPIFGGPPFETRETMGELTPVSTRECKVSRGICDRCGKGLDGKYVPVVVYQTPRNDYVALCRECGLMAGLPDYMLARQLRLSALH